jgi:hypothetical protein
MESVFDRYETLRTAYIHAKTAEDEKNTFVALREFIREVDERERRAHSAEQRAEEAEQQLATERARHAAMAADYEKIATGTHPGYWMLEPGDVLFRPTQTRHVRYGEWFCGAHGDLDCWDTRYESVDEYQVYRRIDAPADATKGNQ